MYAVAFVLSSKFRQHDRRRALRTLTLSLKTVAQSSLTGRMTFDSISGMALIGSMKSPVSTSKYTVFIVKSLVRASSLNELPTISTRSISKNSFRNSNLMLTNFLT